MNLMKKFVLVLSLCLMAAAMLPLSAQDFQSLSVDDFARYIQQERVVVVDVRTIPEFQQGAIRDAVNIVWDKDFDAHLQDAALDTNRVLAVYCRSGRRSKMAAQVLVQKGFRVVELDKGILGWMAAKMPVVVEKQSQRQ